MMTPEELRKLVSIKYNAWVPISAIAEIQRDAREGMVDGEDAKALAVALEGVIAGCVHPDKAVRAVMVDLKPIRQVLLSVAAKHPNLFT